MKIKKKRKGFQPYGKSIDPYKWVGSTLKQLKAPVADLPPDVKRRKSELANLIELDPEFIDLILKQTGKKSRRMADYFLKSIVPMQLGYEVSSEFALTTLKDGLRSDTALSGDIEYVMQWLLLQAMTVRMIRMLSLPTKTKNKLQRLWLDRLTARAVTDMQSSIKMPRPRTLDTSNTAATIKNAGGMVSKRSGDSKPHKKKHK